MGSHLDTSSKKTLFLIRQPNGKTKIAGFYRVAPIDDSPLLVTMPNRVDGPCGIEFDDIEYLDGALRYHERTAGQVEMSHIEYKALT